ncbi:MAG: hypothetical protein HKN25_00445 [Pyrinomonadaceae bacterium]|nr:hypothetical protein [Pyrinomonadaceae bacterium]
MQNIEFIGTLELGGEISAVENKNARQLFNGVRRQIMEVTLSGEAVLPKHKAAEPITVLCLAGKGVFLAGEELQEEQILETGTLITLEANVPHEVIAKPGLRILVTKFKQDQS